jgi:hypothetical protein
MDGRGDWLEGIKRQTLAEAITLEAARQLADEVLAWPPAVEWQDARVRAEFAGLGPAPELAAITMGFTLARWELERELEAIDHAMRNDRLGRLGPEGALAARFLWRWLPEWLLELKERCTGRLTRGELVSCLDLAERRIIGHRQAS